MIDVPWGVVLVTALHRPGPGGLIGLAVMLVIALLAALFARWLAARWGLDIPGPGYPFGISAGGRLTRDHVDRYVERVEGKNREPWMD